MLKMEFTKRDGMEEPTTTYFTYIDLCLVKNRNEDMDVNERACEPKKL